MSRSFKKEYTKSKLIDKQCRNHGKCNYCVENRLYKNNKKTKLKEELRMRKEEEENKQDYYDSIMTKKLAKRILELREREVRWKDMLPYIIKEFGEKYVLEDNTITGMYLEYSAVEFLKSKSNGKKGT